MWDGQKQELELLSHRPPQRATLLLGHPAWPKGSWSTQQPGCSGNAVKTSGDLPIPTPTTSKQMGETDLTQQDQHAKRSLACPQRRGSAATARWCSPPAAPPSPKSGTCPSWPSALLFNLSSKKLSSHSVLRAAEAAFSRELKCQADRHKKVWAGAFRNRKEVVTPVIYCGRFCSAIATYHYTSFILFHLADVDSFLLFLTEHKPTWLHFKWFQTLPMAIKKKFSQLH